MAAAAGLKASAVISAFFPWKLYSAPYKTECFASVGLLRGLSGLTTLPPPPLLCVFPILPWALLLGWRLHWFACHTHNSAGICDSVGGHNSHRSNAYTWWPQGSWRNFCRWSIWKAYPPHHCSPHSFLHLHKRKLTRPEQEQRQPGQQRHEILNMEKVQQVGLTLYWKQKRSSIWVSLMSVTRVGLRYN